MKKLYYFILILGFSISISTFAANATQAAGDQLNSEFASLQLALEKAIAVLKTDVVNFLKCSSCKR